MTDMLVLGRDGVLREVELSEGELPGLTLGHLPGSWKEFLHPRGGPKNKGQFAKKPVGSLAQGAKFHIPGGPPGPHTVTAKTNTHVWAQTPAGEHFTIAGHEQVHPHVGTPPGKPALDKPWTPPQPKTPFRWGDKVVPKGTKSMKKIGLPLTVVHPAHTEGVGGDQPKHTHTYLRHFAASHAMPHAEAEQKFEKYDPAKHGEISGDDLMHDPFPTVKSAGPPPPKPPPPVGGQNGEPQIDFVKMAGGSNGAYFGQDSQGVHYVVKTYRGNEDRVATELLANHIYDALGIPVSKARVVHGQDGKAVLAEPLVDGEIHRIDRKSEELGKGFMADALLANWDVVGLEDDNILWTPEGMPIRLDQGGTLAFRAMGSKKPFGPVPTEVWTMLGPKGQPTRAMVVTDQMKLDQAEHIAQTLTPEKIDLLVDAAPFKDEKMRQEVADALKARVEWMKRFAAGDEQIPRPDRHEEKLAEIYDDFDSLMLAANAYHLAKHAVHDAAEFERMHPRWPKGTPHGGEFIRVGQHLTYQGKDYRVTAVGKGFIHVNEAVKGSYGKKTGTGATLSLKSVADQSDEGKHYLQGAGHSKFGTEVAPPTEVIHIAVQDDHDPSLKQPAGMTLAEGAWERFGRLDQENAIRLQELYGNWNHDKALKIAEEQMAAADAEIRQIVQEGFTRGYQSSTGYGKSQSKGNSLEYYVEAHGWTPATAERLQKAFELQAAYSDVAQWDLYNRLGQPDVMLLHRASSSDFASAEGSNIIQKVWNTYKNKWGGAKSGMSYAWKLGAWSGDVMQFVPVAVRNVLISNNLMNSKIGGATAGAFAGSGKGEGEAEFVVRPYHAYEEGKALMTTESTLPQKAKTWIQKMSQNAPAHGGHFKQLLDFLNNGANLPVEPETLSFFANVEHGKKFKPHPPTAEAAAWAQTVDLNDKLTPTPVPLVDLSLQPGDMIVSKVAGTPYMIVHADDTPTGMAYWNLKTGESYTLESAASTYEFFQVKGHFDGLPAPKVQEGFKSTSVDELQPVGGGQILVSAMKQGDYLAIHGEAIQITGVPNVHDDYVTATSLTSGLTGKIPTNALGMPMTLGPPEPPPLVLQQGMIFGVGGEKHTVTKILKSGEVWAKGPHGKVIFHKDDFAPDGPHHGTEFYQPADYTVGDKAKLKSMAYGTIFQGGAGVQTHKPYRVISVGTDGNVSVKDLSTGEEYVWSGNKSFSVLTPKAPIEPPEEPAVVYPPGAAQAPSAGDVQEGFPKGDNWPPPEGSVLTYTTNSGSNTFKYTVTGPQNPNGTVPTTNDDGNHVDIAGGLGDMTATAGTWTYTPPSAVSAPDEPQFMVGDVVSPAEINDLPDGTVLEVHAGSYTHKQVVTTLHGSKVLTPPGDDPEIAGALPSAFKDQGLTIHSLPGSPEPVHPSTPGHAPWAVSDQVLSQADADSLPAGAILHSVSGTGLEHDWEVHDMPGGGKGLKQVGASYAPMPTHQFNFVGQADWTVKSLPGHAETPSAATPTAAGPGEAGPFHTHGFEVGDHFKYTNKTGKQAGKTSEWKILAKNDNGTFTVQKVDASGNLYGKPVENWSQTSKSHVVPIKKSGTPMAAPEPADAPGLKVGDQVPKGDAAIAALDALPVGSQITGITGTPWTKRPDGTWRHPNGHSAPSEDFGKGGTWSVSKVGGATAEAPPAPEPTPPPTPSQAPVYPDSIPVEHYTNGVKITDFDQVGEGNQIGMPNMPDVILITHVSDTGLSGIRYGPDGKKQGGWSMSKEMFNDIAVQGGVVDKLPPSKEPPTAHEPAPEQPAFSSTDYSMAAAADQFHKFHKSGKGATLKHFTKLKATKVGDVVADKKGEQWRVVQHSPTLALLQNTKTGEHATVPYQWQDANGKTGNVHVEPVPEGAAPPAPSAAPEAPAAPPAPPEPEVAPTPAPEEPSGTFNPADVKPGDKIHGIHGGQPFTVVSNVNGQATLKTPGGDTIDDIDLNSLAKKGYTHEPAPAGSAPEPELPPTTATPSGPPPTPGEPTPMHPEAVPASFHKFHKTGKGTKLQKFTKLSAAKPGDVVTGKDDKQYVVKQQGSDHAILQPFDGGAPISVPHQWSAPTAGVQTGHTHVTNTGPNAGFSPPAGASTPPTEAPPEPPAPAAPEAPTAAPTPPEEVVPGKGKLAPPEPPNGGTTFPPNSLINFDVMKAIMALDPGDVIWMTSGGGYSYKRTVIGHTDSSKVKFKIEKFGPDGKPLPLKKGEQTTSNWSWQSPVASHIVANAMYGKEGYRVEKADGTLKYGNPPAAAPATATAPEAPPEPSPPTPPSMAGKTPAEISKALQGPLVTPHETVSLPASGGAKAVAQKTLDAIAAIHKVPKKGAGKLTIKSMPGSATGTLGVFRHMMGVPLDLRLKAKAPEMAAAHEFGHYLDLHLLGKPGQFASVGASGTGDPLTKDLMSAIFESPEYKSIKHVYKNSPKFRNYLANPKEAFARAYSQYVATKSGGKIDLHPPGFTHFDSPKQWSAESFKPIEAEFDKLFESLGWK